MKITLFDLNPEMCAAWREEFNGIDDVDIIDVQLSDLGKHQYLVTTGNSYAIMNSGIDLAVRNRLGVHVQDRVQWQAVEDYGGKIPVGECISVRTGNAQFPWLIYAPTMEVPEPIKDADIVRIVFANILRKHTNATSIACCGLGANTGRLEPDIVARNMRQAYSEVFGI